MSTLGRATLQSGEERPHVVALCGSRRDGSYTRRALEEALAGVEAAGGSAELLNLTELHLPPFDPNTESAGDGDVLRQTIGEADAVILGSPVYHGSYSGVLKNAVDYCGVDDFERTTVGLLVVSGGPFPTTALEHLRGICRSLNAWVLPHQAAIPRAHSAFDENGLIDRDLREHVRTLGVRAVEYTTIEPRPVPAASCQEM